MNLRDWQVWHTYTSYLLTSPNDLSVAAARLVESGLCELAVVDGEHYWARSGQAAVSGNLEIVRSAQSPQGRFALPSGLQPFQLECLFQAAWLDTQERYLLGRQRALNSIRGFLPVCRMEFGGWGIDAYPIVKIYKHGPVLLTFRVLSGEGAYQVASFVNEQVNLFRHVASAVSIAPSVFRAYALARVPEDVRELRRMGSYLRQLDDWLRTSAVEDHDGAFESAFVQLVGNFDLAPEHGESGSDYTLRVLASIIEHTVHGALRGKTSVPGILRAARDSSVWGASWAARPSIFLITFDGQPRDSKAAVRRFSQELATIMYRTPMLPQGVDPQIALGQDLRPFGDYSVFVTKEVTLWVFGSDHSATSTREGNWGSVIYDKQVQAELVDYRYSAHMQLAERALNSEAVLSSLVGEEERLAEIENDVERSHFGEINSLLESADRALGLDRLRARTRDALRRRGLLADEYREVSARRFEVLLNVLIAVTGLPALAEMLEPPLKEWLGALGIPASWMIPVIWAITGAVLVVVLTIAHRVVRPRAFGLGQGYPR